MAQQIEIGDTVRFNAAGRKLAEFFGTWQRTVTGFEDGFVKLACGNVKLLARPDEIEIVKKREK